MPPIANARRNHRVHPHAGPKIYPSIGPAARARSAGSRAPSTRAPRASIYNSARECAARAHTSARACPPARERRRSRDVLMMSRNTRARGRGVWWWLKEAPPPPPPLALCTPRRSSSSSRSSCRAHVRYVWQRAGVGFSCGDGAEMHHRESARSCPTTRRTRHCGALAGILEICTRQTKAFRLLSTISS